MELKPKTRVELRISVRYGHEAVRALRMPEPMPEEIKPQELPEPVLLAFAPLHKVGLGVALGVTSGLLLFGATLALVIKGGYPVGPTLGLLRNFFPGYSVTWEGAFVGLVWGFLSGFVLGWLTALLHNFLIWVWLVVIRSRAEMDQYSDFLDHM